MLKSGLLFADFLFLFAGVGRPVADLHELLAFEVQHGLRVQLFRLADLGGPERVHLGEPFLGAAQVHVDVEERVLRLLHEVRQTGLERHQAIDVVDVSGWVHGGHPVVEG
jgi:hypothetical protein